MIRTDAQSSGFPLATRGTPTGWISQALPLPLVKKRPIPFASTQSALSWSIASPIALRIPARADLGKEGDRPPEPIARREMRVGDDMAEKRHVQEVAHHRDCRAQRICKRGRRVDASAVHRAIGIGAEHREAGAGAADGPAACDLGVDCRGDRRALPEADIFRLVAAGDEDAIRAAQNAQHARIVGRLAAGEDERLRPK